MGITNAITRPPSCMLVNVATGKSMTCLFNPSQLSEAIQVNYNRLVVPGMSHHILQYQSTSNRQLFDVEFYVDRFFASKQSNHPDILAFRTFMRSLTVPLAPAKDIAETAPPRVLFIWPKVITIETVLTTLDFQYDQFGTDGSVLIYTAICSMEEIIDVRITSQDVLRES